MKKTAIFYGSSTGTTEKVAKEIAKLLSADVFNVANNPIEEVKNYQNLIFGTSTLGVGDLQDDWNNFIKTLQEENLNGKVCAIFGVGNGHGHPDTFVDGIGKIYRAIENKECKIVGFVDTAGYVFKASNSVIDGKFVGLPLNEKKEGDLTKERIEKWLEQIKPELH